MAGRRLSPARLILALLVGLGLLALPVSRGHARGGGGDGGGRGGAGRGARPAAPPPTPAERLAEARARLAEGKVAEAVRAYRAALEPGTLPAEAVHEAHLAIGGSLIASQAPQAERELRLALAAKPDSADAEFGLAQALEQQGKHDMARREYERAIQYRPGFTLALVHLAVNRTRASDPQAAEAAWQAALAASPQKPLLWSTYATALDGAGLEAQAVEASRNGAASLGTATAWWEHARFAYVRQAYEPALAAVESAVALGEATVAAHVLLGELRMRAGRVEPALASFEIALRRAPDGASTWRSLRLALRRRTAERTPGDVAAALLRVQAKVGESAAAWSEVGFAEALERRYPEAARAFLRALAFPGREGEVEEVLWEAARVLGSRFQQLSDALLSEDPTRVRILDMARAEADRRASAERRRLADLYRVNAGGDARTHGLDRTAADLAYEVDRQMRDTHRAIASHLGPLGVVWTPR